MFLEVYHSDPFFFCRVRTLLKERLIKRAEGGKRVAPPKERPPRLLCQSQSVAELMAITTKKKYATAMKQCIGESRRLHSYSGFEIGARCASAAVLRHGI